LRANDQNDRAGASDGNKEVSGLVGVPAFQGGGRVERTGIALVHEGEYVLPALGAEAVIAPENETTSAGQVINYYFPVQIEIVGTLNERQLKRVAEYVYADLHTELDSRGLP
jgi:hypothetical protein